MALIGVASDITMRKKEEENLTQTKCLSRRFTQYDPGTDQPARFKRSAANPAQPGGRTAGYGPWLSLPYRTF